MGKHERSSIEEAEKIVVKILNSKNITEKEKSNTWIDHSYAIAEKIKKDYHKFSFSKHLGNTYDSLGDIKLKLSNGNSVFVELKMSEYKGSVGTKANISQNALTDNGLFVGNNIKSWKEFREEKNHYDWVENYLDKFKRYPKSIRSVSSRKKKIYEKARYLRDLKNKGGWGSKKSNKILENIRERDRKEKLNYISYLEKLKQDKENIEKFLTLTLLGFHRQEDLKKLMPRENLLKEVEALIIYYANKNNSKISIEKEDVGNRVSDLLKKFKEFQIKFFKNKTHCKIIGLREDSSEESFLQIVFHWKNIAQGIKTPCLNIFDINKELESN